MKPDIEYVYNALKKLRFDFKESDRKLFPNEYTFDYSLNRYVRVDGNDLYISKDTFKPLEEELEYADKCHNLEQELGCPLDVVLNLIKRGHFYAEKPNHKGTAYCMFLPTIMFVAKGYRDIEDNSFILSASTMQLFNRKELHSDGWNVNLADYKKTWWLKEDRSE